MSALQAQQRALQAVICTPGLGAAGLLRPPADTGLGVYQQAYPARLIAALRDNYTVLYRALGDEDFDALASAYLQARPSAQASIRWFGDRLADFMAEGPAEALPHPSLVDFARMDWALRGAFDAAEAPLLQAQDLASLAPQDWADLVFPLHPSVALQDLDWAIAPAWRALRAHEPDSGEDAPRLDEPEPLAQVLLVWRQGLDTRWRMLEPLEARLLRAAGEGRSFGAICALAAEALGEAAAAGAVVRTLQHWLADGLLAKRA